VKRITISNFKGIKSLKDLCLYKSLQGGGEKEVNLLLYAENGGGKTSISEAIRLVSFANVIENEVIGANIVDEEREAAKRDWLTEYLHDKSTESFEIEIDGFKFSSINAEVLANANISVLDRTQLVPSSKIDIKQIISRTHFEGISSYEELFSPVAIELVLSEVNAMLKEEFRENIKVVRVETVESIVGIKGIHDGIITENIDSKLNESNQNLIKILIFINYLTLLPPTQDGTKRFVVLDDIMSSLDLANRIILARIIIKLGNDYQLLVMTHNVGFYNMIKHLAASNNVCENWIFSSLYTYDENHIPYSVDNEDTVDELLKKHGGVILPTNGDAVNAMRKKFENLLHEFGKILILGIQEETSDLIDKISMNNSNLYCYVEGNNILTHFDLIKNISTLTNCCPASQLKSRINNVFQKYNNNNMFPWISETVQHLRTYQKVILHQGSHDQCGTLPAISSKEITITLDLMKKLEKITNRSSTSYPYFI
jgi:hypothetical protein